MDISSKAYIKFIQEELEGISNLILAKQHDYANPDDALINFRGKEHLNISPLLSIWIRMTDKHQRVESFLSKGSLKNEGIKDAFRDIIGYSLLSLFALEVGDMSPQQQEIQSLQFRILDLEQRLSDYKKDYLVKGDYESEI